METIPKYEGCVECVTREFLGHSNVALEWLYWIAGRDEIEIQHADNGDEYRIPNTWLKCDGYCKETNTIYEFYGKFYHGSPRLFPRDYVNPVSKKTMGELYDKTMKRKGKIREMGYQIVKIWEDEWDFLKAKGFDEEITSDKIWSFWVRNT